MRTLDIVEFCVIYSRTFLEHLEIALARFCFVCCMYEKRDVTYLADTGQRYHLLLQVNKRHGFCMLQRATMYRKRGLSLIFASEAFVKKAAFRLYENKTRAVSLPPKRKSKKKKDITLLRQLASEMSRFMWRLKGYCLYLVRFSLILLWLCICKFAASKHCPWARRTKRRFKRFHVSLLSFCLSTSQVKMKEQLGYSANWHWNWGPETPLAVTVMDTSDWRPPKRSFRNGKNRWRSRVTDNRCKYIPVQMNPYKAFEKWANTPEAKIK